MSKAIINKYEANHILTQLCQPLNVDLTVEEKAIEHDSLLVQLETLTESVETIQGDSDNYRDELTELKERLEEFNLWALTEMVPKIEKDELTTTELYEEMISELKKSIRG